MSAAPPYTGLQTPSSGFEIPLSDQFEARPTSEPSPRGEQPHPQPFVKIAGTEWRWLAAMTLLIVAITLIPPTLGRLYGPQDRVHLGTYWYNQDFTQYQATMREAATSPSWLVHDHSSAEPHDPVFMFPLYAAIGKLAAATSIDALAVYAVVEMAGRLVLPMALYVFAASMIGSVAGRRLAFVLAAFSSGLGFWVALGQTFAGVANASPDGRQGASAYVVEVVTFGAFFTAPHLALGLAAILLAVVLFGWASRGSIYGLVGLALDIGAIGLLNPFNLPLLLLAFGLYAAWQSWTERGLARWSIAACMVAGAAAAPMVLYNFLIFTFAPFWSVAYGSDNRLASPGPWNLPIDFGVVFLLAPFDILAIRRSLSGEQRLLLIWLILSMVCMYLPVAYQRRFAFGLQPALAIFAALAWPVFRQGFFERVRRGASPALASWVTKRVGRYGLPALAFPTTAMGLLIIGLSAATNAPLDYYMVDRDTYALGEWIAARSGPEDVVAGSLNTGNVLSGIIPGRVVARWERNHATLHGERKSATIEAMYQGALTPEQTSEFLTENRTTYLIVGPEERKLGAYDPGPDLGLPVATRIGAATAYHVVPEAIGGHFTGADMHLTQAPDP